MRVRETRQCGGGGAEPAVNRYICLHFQAASQISSLYLQRDCTFLKFDYSPVTEFLLNEMVAAVELSKKRAKIFLTS